MKPVCACCKNGKQMTCFHVAVSQKMYPKWNPGNWKRGPKPAVPWWFNFDPYPCSYLLRNAHQGAPAGPMQPLRTVEGLRRQAPLTERLRPQSSGLSCAELQEKHHCPLKTFHRASPRPRFGTQATQVIYIHKFRAVFPQVERIREGSSSVRRVVVCQEWSVPFCACLGLHASD